MTGMQMILIIGLIILIMVLMSSFIDVVGSMEENHIKKCIESGHGWSVAGHICVPNSNK